MGNNLSVRNSKHQVTMNIEDGNSVLSFKVRDRRNPTNPQHFLHYKRYKHFQLPLKIKQKFKTVKQFYQYLQQNASIINLDDNNVIIDFNQQKIKIPFQNVNQESKIFCQTQNIQMDNRRELGSNQINIVLGSNRSGWKNLSQDLECSEDCKETLKEVVNKLMRINSPLEQPNLQGKDLESLVLILQEEWKHFEQKGATIPNMTKKKAKDVNSEVETLKEQIQIQTTQIQALKKKNQLLQTQFNGYKTWFNLQKFSEEQEKMSQKTKNKVMDELLSEMSELFNRLSNNNSSSKITIQIKTKTALLTRIQNTVKQLEQLRINKRTKNQTQSTHIPVNPNNSSIFTQLVGGNHLDQNQKMSIQNKFSDF